MRVLFEILATEYDTASMAKVGAKITRRKIAKIPFGMVTIAAGEHAGRIGVYDENDGRYGCVTFAPLEYAIDWYLIPRSLLREVATTDLIARNKAISMRAGFRADSIDPHLLLELFSELLLVDNALGHRMIEARQIESATRRRVFISHSSKDRQFARWLAVDLGNKGHVPWLDEWQIRVGDSIPTRIGEGLDSSGALIVVLSEHAVSSRWVEREWQAKYTSEIHDGGIQVLPVLLKECEVPALLRMKKYADFRLDYSEGLRDLLAALK